MPLLLDCGIVAHTGMAQGAVAHSLVAHSARTVVAKDTAHLKFVPSASTDFLEVGTATGTLPGTVRAYINVGQPIIVRFTIYTRRGSISGQGSGRLKGNPKIPSFSGKMTISHGTGVYEHARGSGNFYGDLNRQSKNAIVQTAGTFSY